MNVCIASVTDLVSNVVILLQNRIPDIFKYFKWQTKEEIKHEGCFTLQYNSIESTFREKKLNKCGKSR